MTQAFFDHPDLSGRHAPVRFEATVPDSIANSTLYQRAMAA
jgi:hypothetical protein